MDEWIVNLISSVVGGVIAGAATLFGVYLTHKHDLEKQKINEAAVVKGVLQAIHDEIETLWNRYQDEVGVRIETLPANSPFAMYYPVGQDYFTVYTANAFLIGRIEDNDLRKGIVTTYTKARGLVDSFRFNNDLNNKYEHWVSLANQQPGNVVYVSTMKNCLSNLIKYADQLKKEHNDLKINVNNLLRMLHKKGVLQETTVASNEPQ